MAKSYQQLQPELHFDELMRWLDGEFQELPEHRASNTRYALADALKSAFAMFPLKAPSLLDFKKQSEPEANNLRSIYRVNGAIPCDNQMRGILDPLDPSHLRPLFHAGFQHLRRAGVIRESEYWGKCVIVALDGVEQFTSDKVHCRGRLRRTPRNGVVSYHHCGLAAVLVNPAQAEVFPLDFEPSPPQDGAQKTDCARPAARRLCAGLHQCYYDLNILLVEDALNANAPHVRQISSYGWKYVLNVKPDYHLQLE
jgi:hypothetical protein